MPFTLSHTAAVLPLLKNRKRTLNRTALILGSMAPDFEYFLHFRPLSIFGHSLWGQLWFNLPLTILAAFWFHRLIKRILILHLPEFLCIRFQSLLEESEGLKQSKDWLIFIYSSLIGMATHLLWDSLTHGTADILILTKPFSQSILNRPIYNWIQHLSSLAGMMIIWRYLKKLPKKRGINLEAPPVRKWVFWLTFLGIQIFLWLIVLFITKDNRPGRLIVSYISCGILSLSILPLIFSRRISYTGDVSISKQILNP